MLLRAWIYGWKICDYLKVWKQILVNYVSLITCEILLVSLLSKCCMILHTGLRILFIITCLFIAIATRMLPLLLDLVLFALLLFDRRWTWGGCAAVCHVVIFLFDLLLHW